MDLIIKNKIIEAPITDILEAIRVESGSRYFNFIGKDNFENVRCTCPYHKAGQELRPSAAVYNDRDNPEVEYGFFKCFTCGKKVPLYEVVAHCLNLSEEDAKDWLIDTFGSILTVDRRLPPLKEKKKRPEKIILDENVLTDYNYIHPYMYQRALSKEIIAKYKIGYDPDTNSITFPCWDMFGNLVSVNRRNVEQKRFELVENVEKEIYLLNYAIKEHASCIYVMESQLNALSYMSAFPAVHAVALMGTGTKHQYELLRKSGIRNFVLGLDPDLAGQSGTIRFINALKDTAFISVMDLPEGKDINDLMQDKNYDIPILSIQNWCKKYNKKIS